MSRTSALMLSPASNAYAPAVARPMAVRVPTIQRACACGGSAGLTGKCASCENEQHLGKSVLQPKLTISTPDDPYEREADRIAGDVMRMPGPATRPLGISPLIQREEAPAAEDEEELAATLQREAAGQDTPAEDEEELQREAVPGGPVRATGGLSASLLASASGTPLPLAARGFFESRFGRDLDHVRVHSDATAGAMARSINARAFTHGHDIYFSAGQYDPVSIAGRSLLAHELTHVFQQDGKRTLRRKALSPGLAAEATVRLPMDGPANRNEVAAERAAAKVGSTGSAAADAPPPASGTAPSDGAADLPASLAAAIARPSGGTALPPSLAIENEARLGTSLAHVRVHQGPGAIALTRALDARAFTYGADIWLGEGESTADRRLMAHELAHVAQQAPGSARLQTKLHYQYVLPVLGKGSGGGPGTRTHLYVLGILGHEAGKKGKELYTEVPIPGGATVKPGIADMVTTDKNVLPGITFAGDTPRFQPLLDATKHNGANAPASLHAATAAPAGNAGGRACTGQGLPRGKGICRVKPAPKNIYIGDLKPNDPDEINKGKGQVGGYIAAISKLTGQVNSFAAASPDLVRPKGATWTTNPVRMKSLAIPKVFDPPTAKSPSIEAQLYIDGKPTAIREKATPEIIKHGEGIWTYDFIALRDLTGQPTAKATTPGPVTTAKTELEKVKKEVKAPATARSIAKLRRLGPRRIQRKTETLKAEDNFKLETWKQSSYGPWRQRAEAATGGAGALARSKASADAKERMKDEAAQQIRERTGLSSIKVVAGTTARARELEVVQHWIDHGETYGRLRQIFGTGFVKLVNVYEKVKGKIATKVAAIRRRFAGEAKGVSDPKSAAIAGLKRIAGSLLVLFVRDIGRRLVGAVTKGAAALLGTLFGEEKAKIEEQIKYIEDREKEFRDFIREQIEARFSAEIEKLQELVATIENVAAKVKKIGWLVNMVKWAIRIAQCGLPPLLGCIIGLITSKVVEMIIAGIIASCWFQREIGYPIVSALKEVTNVPAKIARFIADKARALLPGQLKLLIGDTDTSEAKTSSDVVDCDSTSKYNLDPSQTKLAEMLAAHDPEKVEAMLAALKHLGVASDDPNPKAKVTDAEIANLKKLLDKYSKTQFEELVEKTEPRVPSSKTTSEFVLDLEQAAKQPAGRKGGTAGQPSQPGAPSSTAGGTGTAGGADVISDEQKKEEGAEVKRRLAKVKNVKPFSFHFQLDDPKPGDTAYTFVTAADDTWRALSVASEKSRSTRCETTDREMLLSIPARASMPRTGAISRPLTKPTKAMCRSYVSRSPRGAPNDRLPPLPQVDEGRPRVDRSG